MHYLLPRDPRDLHVLIHAATKGQITLFFLSEPPRSQLTAGSISIVSLLLRYGGREDRLWDLWGRFELLYARR